VSLCGELCFSGAYGTISGDGTTNGIRYGEKKPARVGEPVKVFKRLA